MVVEWLILWCCVGDVIMLYNGVVVEMVLVWLILWC